jgi:uncharacterized protein (DUF2141 family)
MKTLVLIILLAITNYIAHSQESTGIDITVQINNLKNDNGFVLLGLHNQETFINTETPALNRIQGKIKNGKIKVVFKNVLEGVYAIMVVHDENANNKMDFELNGMPKEAYGMSNNNMSYGPPVFEDAKFKVTDKNLELEIRM